MSATAEDIVEWAKRHLNVELLPWQREFVAAALRGDRVIDAGRRSGGLGTALRVVHGILRERFRAQREAEIAEVREINRALPFAHPIALDREPVVWFGKPDEAAPTIESLARMTPIYGFKVGPFIYSESIA